MDYIRRKIEKPLKKSLSSGKSILLLGARQTGKTTLLQMLNADRMISLVNFKERVNYAKNPENLTYEIEELAREKQKIPLVIIDEVQKIPLLLDGIQDLIDRNVAQFVISGSSARKLRRKGQTNLLPGRVHVYHLDPLTLEEAQIENPSLDELLLYGSLPEILLMKAEKEKTLDSYVNTYLEEEIIAEAVVREIGHFAKFLELAASESGYIVNFRKLSQEIGVAHTTIMGYYEILEDCLVAERIEPLTKAKGKRKLIQTPKYLMFDLGVRRVAAGEGVRLPKQFMGHLLEQFVGLELIRHARLEPQRTKIRFWRDSGGPEVDWVIDQGGRYTPIEVKYTVSPTPQDAKHLFLFLEEYAETSTEFGYLVCQAPRRMIFKDKVIVLPWQEMHYLWGDRTIE